MRELKDSNNKVIFLFGPTAVGKTQLLFDFFSEIGEVINADSVQVYKNLNIASAKADLETQKKIKHHLIDILEPWQTFNVADFVHLADDSCKEIWQRNKIPVISGGTAYYFKHFMYGLSEAPQADSQIRKEVELYIKEHGLGCAHAYLGTIDAISASKINVNDAYRISRAIEVYKQTGRALSSFALPKTVRNNMNILAIGLYRNKEELDKRIRERVNIMFKEGIIEEIKNLIQIEAKPSWQSMQGIGYREFMDKIYNPDKEISLNNLEKLTEVELSEIADKITLNSVHYAKRQMTFFKSFANVNWIYAEDTEGLDKLLKTFL